MRQIIDYEHLRVYGIVTRYIELVTVQRLFLLVDDVLTRSGVFVSVNTCK